MQFCVKVDNNQEAPLTTSVLGIDVGLEYFYSDSNGKHEENPRYLRKAEKDIKARIIRHVKVEGDASPYDGNLIYWSTRMGEHPETTTRVAT